MDNFDSSPLVMEAVSTASTTKMQMRAHVAGTITSLESLREHLQWAIGD